MSPSAPPNEYDFYGSDHMVPNRPEYRPYGHHLISDQVTPASLHVICRELAGVLRAGIAGEIVEFGCYVGTTSLFLRRVLDAASPEPKRELHVYDSFNGLPAKTQADNSAAGVDFQAGKLRVGKKELLRQFKAANLRPPVVHKGWFKDLTAADVPERICFAFLDGDFYDSILHSLRLVWPRLQAGACLVIDDYKREALPGVERAITDFFKTKPQPQIQAEQGLAVIRL